MRGQFLIHDPTLLDAPAEVLPNTLTNLGEAEYLKMIFRADETLIASGANWYMGLCAATPDDALTLSAAAVTEPTIGVSGYARQGLSRDATGWPTLDTTNGEVSMTSKTLTFAANSGGTFDAAITRLFLADTQTGISGTLLSIGAALAAPKTITDSETLPVQYQAFLY